jgi:hypothetical protein
VKREAKMLKVFGSAKLIETAPEHLAPRSA